MNCKFCKISNKENTALIVCESENTISFLDKNPMSAGHILIIPKAHYVSIYDCPDEILQELISETKRVAELIKVKLKTDSVNILNASGKNAQQSTKHLHFHIVPRFKGDNLNLWFLDTDKSSVSPEEVFQKLTGSKSKSVKGPAKTKKLRNMMPLPPKRRHEKALPPSVYK